MFRLLSQAIKWQSSQEFEVSLVEKHVWFEYSVVFEEILGLLVYHFPFRFGVSINFFKDKQGKQSVKCSSCSGRIFDLLLHCVQQEVFFGCVPYDVLENARSLGRPAIPRSLRSLLANQPSERLRRQSINVAHQRSVFLLLLSLQKSERRSPLLLLLLQLLPAHL